MTRKEFWVRGIVGGVALATWALFFATGLLVETGKYRRFLAPEFYASQAQAQGEQGTPPPQYTGSYIGAFAAATLCYTPTNLLFLTLLAGLVGGCSSNLVADRLKERDAAMSPRRLMYLEEAPWAAMMRGFVVYLCFIAGLYFIIDDPFKDPTAAQYMRLAGTLSVLAFVVGYDPSRIEQWLRLAPTPQPGQMVTVQTSKEGVELTAAQGEMVTADGQPDREEPAGADEGDDRLLLRGADSTPPNNPR